MSIDITEMEQAIEGGKDLRDKLALLVDYLIENHEHSPVTRLIDWAQDVTIIAAGAAMRGHELDYLFGDSPQPIVNLYDPVTCYLNLPT